MVDGPAGRPRPRPPPVAGRGRTVEFLGNYTAFADLRRAPVSRPAGRRLTVAVVHPDLLGTYGDGGNGVVLARRAGLAGDRRRPGPGPLGPAAADGRPLHASAGARTGPRCGRPPPCAEDGTLARRVAEGAVVLAVCAGFQLVGRTFPDAAGPAPAGLGLLDLTTPEGHRARGPWGSWWPSPTPGAPDGRGRPAAAAHRVREPRRGDLGRPRGPAAGPRGARGGQRRGDGTEGAWAGRVLGTYLHGPVLARNTAAGRPAARMGAGAGRRSGGDGGRARAPRRLRGAGPADRATGGGRHARRPAGWRGAVRRVRSARTSGAGRR